jgi:hypothetical protein
MDPQKLAALLNYLALVPTAIPIALNVIDSIRKLAETDTKITEQDIKDLVDKALRNHAELPSPDDVFRR